jgi:hypothetical protein
MVFLRSLLLLFSHYCCFNYLVIVLVFPLPIDAFCDCIPARTSDQELGLLFRMAQTEILCDTGNVKVFLSYGSSKYEYWTN